MWSSRWLWVAPCLSLLSCALTAKEASHERPRLRCLPLGILSSRNRAGLLLKLWNALLKAWIVSTPKLCYCKLLDYREISSIRCRLCFVDEEILRARVIFLSSPLHSAVLYSVSIFRHIMTSRAELKDGKKLALKCVASLACIGTSQPVSFDEQVQVGMAW